MKAAKAFWLLMLLLLFGWMSWWMMIKRKHAISKFVIFAPKVQNPLMGKYKKMSNQPHLLSLLQKQNKNINLKIEIIGE
jgi:hypothetical protein